MLRAAVDIADKDGIDAVTMRRLGQELGVEAMSLYHHVAGKDEVVTGIVDLLVDEIPTPAPGLEWKASIRARAMSAREFLRGHPWSFRLIAGSRSLSPGLLRHYNAVIADMLRGGFSHQLTHTAMHVLGSRTLGFVEDLFLGNDRAPEVVKDAFREVKAGKYPAILEAMSDVHHDDDLEFAFGLDLILDGLERERDAEAKPRKVAAKR